MARSENSIPNGAPIPGKFNIWGTKKEEEAIKKKQKKDNRINVIHGKKAALYFAGKCKDCPHTDYKRSYVYGGENRICKIWKKKDCPHKFGNC